MENMEQKAVPPSRRVAVTEQGSMSSRNQSAKEHQGLFCVTLGMCVQDAHGISWHLGEHPIMEYTLQKQRGQPLPFLAVSLTRTET